MIYDGPVAEYYMGQSYLCWSTNLRGKNILFKIIDLFNVIDSFIHVDRLASYIRQAN